MYTSYVYEAKSLVSDYQLDLGEAYASKSLIFVIIASLIAAACIGFAAFAFKKARVLGIIAAAAQPLGLFAAFRVVLEYSHIDFQSMEMVKTSTVSMDDAMSQLYSALGDAFMENVFPQMLGILAWAFVLLVVFIVTLIYVIMLLKQKPKGFAVGAMIILIVRYVLFTPVEMFSILMQSASADIQGVWDVVYRLFFILPAVLVGCQALVAFLAERKAKAVAATAGGDDLATEDAAPVEDVLAPVTEETAKTEE